MHFGSCLFLSCTHRKFHDKKNANFLGIFHGGVDNKCIFRICKHGATENLKKVKFASEQNSTRFAAVSQNIPKMSISLALPDADELMKWLSELHCICYFNHPNSSASEQLSNFTTWKCLRATLWASWNRHWERQMMSEMEIQPRFDPLYPKDVPGRKRKATGMFGHFYARSADGCKCG